MTNINNSTASLSLLTQYQIEEKKDIIQSRYQVIGVLGQGGVGITYRAKDLWNHQIVALKALSLRKAKNWKAIELFEREAKVLAELDHPAIPYYIDYFQIDSEEDQQFYIVQSLAPGDSLANLVEKGWIPTVDEIKDIATQILEILIYLHTLMPAVIHRDIKPQNLIRSADGRISLVDFGAVQDTYHHTVTGGSTVVGTYGYMAPEQFRGQAYFSTDLYGLGATILYLLTRKDPGTLPQKNLKIDFWTYVSIPAKFATWLDRTLEPEVLRRFETADRALAVLQGHRELPLLPKQKPPYSRIQLTKSSECLLIKIPAIGFGNKAGRIVSSFVLFWDVVFLFILLQAISNSFAIDPSKMLAFIFFGLCCMWLSVQWCYGCLSDITLRIDDDIITITKSFVSIDYCKLSYDIYTDKWKKYIKPLQLHVPNCKKQALQFVTMPEHKWLISEIESFCDRTASSIKGDKSPDQT
jgi:eukaryotic-like serine/threonine-protein kinase